MGKKKIKVLYIAGATRSGSTLLSNILGEIDGFFNAGELIEIWDRGQKWLCSCGSKVENCEVWKPVLNRVLAGKDQNNINEIIELRNQYAHTKRVPQALIMDSAAKKLECRLKNYVDSISDLYQTIQSVTQSRVIVDASKNVGYAHILEMVPTIDLYMVHLIRDARATAYSWLKKKEGLWTANPLSTSLTWSIRNIVTEMLGKRIKERYIRLHYENFIQNPEQGILNVLNLFKETPYSLPFISEKSVKIGVCHGICGNPDRFNRGIIKLRIDRRWEKMERMDKFLVNTLTWPLLKRYGYPLIPRF
jgi:hypothetical protein